MFDLLIRTDSRYARYLDRTHTGRAEAFRDIFRTCRQRLAARLAVVRRKRTRRRWVATLSRLDDRTLADIGLHRSNIRSAVFEAERRCTAAERRARLATLQGEGTVPAQPRGETAPLAIAAE